MVYRVSSEKLRQLGIGYLLSFGVWLVLALLIAAEDEVRIVQRHLGTPFWKILMVGGAVCFAFAAITPPVFYLVRKYPVTRKNWARRTAGYALGLIPYAIGYVCVRFVILPPWLPVTQQFGTRSLRSFFELFLTFADMTWTYSTTVVAAHAYEYFVRTRKQEIEQAELRQALAASELQALKSQLHPHFLFNTLHGISTLIDTNRAQAKAMILTLSRLLRSALQYDNSDLISLEDEIRFLQSYLELEKMRLAERLQVEWKIDAESRQMLVPQLILQPLVENAIIHGISSSRDGGWLRITSRLDGGTLRLTIENSVGGTSKPGMGLGLQNTKSRLKYLYGEDSSFDFSRGSEAIARASVNVPAFRAHQTEAADLLVSRARAS